jgi:hypothetical protein
MSGEPAGLLEDAIGPDTRPPCTFLAEQGQ